MSWKAKMMNVTANFELSHVEEPPGDGSERRIIKTTEGNFKEKHTGFMSLSKYM